MVHTWVHAGPGVRSSMQAAMPGGWQEPARPQSTFQAPDPSLSFNRTSLEAALAHAKTQHSEVNEAAPCCSMATLLLGAAVVRNGLELAMRLGVRSPCRGPWCRTYWLGLQCGPHSLPDTKGTFKGTLRSAALDKSFLNVHIDYIELGGDWGVNDAWHRIPADADRYELASWEPVFAAEGPEVTVVCEGAEFTL